MFVSSFIENYRSSRPSLPLPKLPVRPRNMVQQQEFLPDKARYEIVKEEQQKKYMLYDESDE